MRHIDMIGRKVGRLTVVERAENDKHGHIVYRCKCDCGSETYVCSSSLTHGHTISCGCYQADCARKVLRKYREEQAMQKQAYRNRVELDSRDRDELSRCGLALSPGMTYKVTDILDLLSARLGRTIQVDVRWNEASKTSVYCLSDSDTYGLGVAKASSESLVDAIIQLTRELNIDNLI